MAAKKDRENKKKKAKGSFQTTLFRNSSRPDIRLRQYNEPRRNDKYFLSEGFKSKEGAELASSTTKKILNSAPDFPFLDEDFERVFVNFVDELAISDGEKELVVEINIEFAFDAPKNGNFDNILLVAATNNSKFPIQ